tara:strand:- start:77 stop:655 length:579 start_codon:yes stop_codon:yes gene_type:complete
MKNVLITGASKRLGLELANLYRKSDNVLGLDSSDIDFSTDYTNESLSLDTTHWDIVIINARTKQHKWSEMMNVNCINQVRFLETIMDRIKEKLIFITSEAGSHYKTQHFPDDPLDFDKLDYKMSKAALNMAMTWFAKKLPIQVLAIHPGTFGYEGATPAAKRAAEVKATIDKTYRKDFTGSFIRYDGKPLQW